MWRGFRALALALAACGGMALAAAGAASAESAGEAKVRADLLRYLRTRAASAEASVEIPPLTRFALDAASVADPLRTRLSTRAEPPYEGRVSITVELMAGERLIARGVVSPYVRVTDHVLSPTRDLRRGDLLAAEDLRTVERDRARVPGDALRDAAEVVGLRVTRSVRKDNVMRRSQVERVPLVERGDRVTLVLETGLLHIRGAGKAKEAGAAGDWIRVVNLDSRRELSGRVDGQGRVHVAF